VRLVTSEYWFTKLVFYLLSCWKVNANDKYKPLFNLHDKLQLLREPGKKKPKIDPFC
jgi:hypothetical protein